MFVSITYSYNLNWWSKWAHNPQPSLQLQQNGAINSTCTLLCLYLGLKAIRKNVCGLHTHTHTHTVSCLGDSCSFCCEPSSLFWLHQHFLYLLSWLLVAPKRNLLINKRCGRLSPRLLTREDFNTRQKAGHPVSVSSLPFLSGPLTLRWTLRKLPVTGTAARGSSLISCIVLILSPTLFPSALPTRFSFPSISFYILLSIVIPTFWLSLSSAGKVEELKRGESPKGWFIISLCLSPYLCHKTFTATQALTWISYRHINGHYPYLCRNTYKTMDIQTGLWDH